MLRLFAPLERGTSKPMLCTGQQPCTKRRPWVRAQARFRAIKLLGRGAEADTWLFADRRRDHAIAMKLFTRPVAKHLVPSILREIRLQSQLGPGHMNLINIYEVLLTDDHLGIAMVRALAQCSRAWWVHCALPHACMLDRPTAGHHSIGVTNRARNDPAQC